MQPQKNSDLVPYRKRRCELRRNETDGDLPQDREENEEPQVHHERPSRLHRLQGREKLCFLIG